MPNELQRPLPAAHNRCAVRSTETVRVLLHGRVEFCGVITRASVSVRICSLPSPELLLESAQQGRAFSSCPSRYRASWSYRAYLVAVTTRCWCRRKNPIAMHGIWKKKFQWMSWQATDWSQILGQWMRVMPLLASHWMDKDILAARKRQRHLPCGDDNHYLVSTPPG